MSRKMQATAHACGDQHSLVHGTADEGVGQNPQYKSVQRPGAHATLLPTWLVGLGSMADRSLTC